VWWPISDSDPIYRHGKGRDQALKRFLIRTIEPNTIKQSKLNDSTFQTM